MANVNELYQIFDMAIPKQAYLLEGPHGIGKSEIVTAYFEKRGYTVIPIFLGQSADAGDVIGLPDKIERTLPNGETVKVTSYCPPFWWPSNPNGKYVIFLDEINRSKEDVRQCIMDLVLNRKMNGRSLPAETYIIAAMNPTNEGYYQVEELDPALLDRFNKVVCNFTSQDWLDYAIDAGVHDYVTGFIAKHPDMLDPPDSKNASPGEVNPSRRSWIRVSDQIKAKPELLDGRRDLLKNYMFTVVGLRAASAFEKYVREAGSGITPESVVVRWDSSMERKIRALSLSEAIHLTDVVVRFLREKSDFLKNRANIEKSTEMCRNLEEFLKCVGLDSQANAEVQAHFYSLLGKAAKESEVWPRYVMNLNKRLGEDFSNLIAK